MLKLDHNEALGGTPPINSHLQLHRMDWHALLSRRRQFVLDRIQLRIHMRCPYHLYCYTIVVYLKLDVPKSHPPAQTQIDKAPRLGEDSRRTAISLIDLIP